MRLNALNLAINRLGVLGAGGNAPWSNAALWPLGASSPGCWIDPPYVASEFQESAGVTALSAIGTVLDTSNPVGLILDRKGGLALGAELVTNGSAFVNTTGWVATGAASCSVVGGKLRVVGGASGSIYLNYSPAISSGKTQQISFEATVISGSQYYVISKRDVAAGGSNDAFFDKTASFSGGMKFVSTGAGGSINIACVNGCTVDFDNISVREIPGIHLSQTTSAARPVASARVNLLTKTEDFSSGWTLGGLLAFGAGSTVNATTAPDGTLTADLITVDSTTADHVVRSAVTGAAAWRASGSISAKPNGWNWLVVSLTDNTSTARQWFNISTGAIGSIVEAGGATKLSAAITLQANGFWRCDFSAAMPSGAASTTQAVRYSLSNADGVLSVLGDGSSGAYVWGAQLNLGSTALPYQRVNTASDYTASAGPTFSKFDGTDDSWASATFAAGTLTSSMDCLIAVRRDSAANFLLAYSAAGVGNYFGHVESGLYVASVSVTSGAPTIFVDGVQLAGGIAVTTDTLSAALTVGGWHVVEFRGLDLSTWTAIAAGNWGVGYQLNGALGGIQLFANGQDANRTLARAAMAAYFGVTLPTPSASSDLLLESGSYFLLEDGSKLILEA